ncbi:HopW family type III effector protein [Erwinia papayae]|uniref:HopW family type III effector protein n=1 Tax=Erwinia papayae TaxID=206499 RepID=A0ABV3N0B2_9GAMM
MNPAQIARASHSCMPMASGGSGAIDKSDAQSSRQARTRAFVASGKLSTAFGRSSTASAQDCTSLLHTFQRELEKSPQSFPAIAELAGQLSEAALGEQNGHWLGNEQQQTLKEMIDRCTSQLAHTPMSHASYKPLSQACTDLTTARMQQSVSQMVDQSHQKVQGVPDLLALIHTDPTGLAGNSAEMPSGAKFSAFLCTARDRTAELSETLRNHSADVTPLLQSHVDTLLHLEKLPEALAAWTESCRDTPVQHDLRALANAAGELTAQLRQHGLLPPSTQASGEPGEMSVRSDDGNAHRHFGGLSHMSSDVSSSAFGSFRSEPARSSRMTSDAEKTAGLYAEKKRTNWTKSTGVAGKVSHKIQSLLGKRDVESRVQAFVSFMADAKGKPDATMLDLGDGWMRVSRQIKGETALIDVQCDSDGKVLDARHPGKFPLLPEGSEREAFDTVLHELKSTGAEALSKVPVYYVNRNTRGYLIPTHGYVVAGHPNQGRKSGAVLYGVGGDPKRGPVNINDKLLAKLIGSADSKAPFRLAAPVRKVISQLAGKSFATREDFYNAYRSARGEGVDPQELHNEISSVYRHLPMTMMEMWPKKAGDYRVAKPPAPERDLRAFENFPKDIGRKVTLKKIADVDSLDLMEARQQFTLHQLYQDELMGRDGTAIPSEHLKPKADEEKRQQLQDATPKFQRLPPHKTDKVGNCNTGASSLLQRAVDIYTEKNQLPAKKVSAASSFGIGSGHRLSLWDPLTGSSAKKSSDES